MTPERIAELRKRADDTYIIDAKYRIRAVAIECLDEIERLQKELDNTKTGLSKMSIQYIKALCWEPPT